MNARSLRQLIWSALSALTFAVPALAGPGDIADLAPKSSFLVVSVPDFTKFREAFARSELGKLWDEPGVKAFVEELTKEQSKQFAELMKEFGADAEDVKPPTGMCGLALIMPASMKKDSHGKTPPPDSLVVADMGDNAASWRDLIEKMVEKGERDRQLISEEDTYASTKIAVLHPVYKEPETKKPENNGDADDEDHLDDEPVQQGLAGFLGGSKESPRTLYIAWADKSLLVSTNLSAIETALDGNGGKDIDSVADTSDYKDALAQHPAGTQAHFIFLLPPVMEQVREELKASAIEGGSPVNPEVILEVLGIKSVRAVSVGLRADSPDATAEWTLGVLTPEKKGLLSLIADPIGPFDPGTFVPSDAATVSKFSFHFDRLFDLARDVIATFPEAQRAQPTMMLDQATGMVKPALDTMGPVIHTVTTYKQPLAADSQATVIAIDFKDQATITNTLVLLAGQAGGMVEPRDFEGNTIYSIQETNVAVGLGTGRLYIGPPAAVESSLRLAGRADNAKISSEAGFKEATRVLSSEGCMYSYADTRQALRMAYWGFQNLDKVAEAQIKDLELDEAEKADFLRSMREEQPKWIAKLPPLEEVLAHLGDTAFELRPTPEGFRGRALMIKPDGAAKK